MVAVGKKKKGFVAEPYKELQSESPEESGFSDEDATVPDIEEPISSTPPPLKPAPVPTKESSLKPVKASKTEAKRVKEPSKAEAKAKEIKENGKTDAVHQAETKTITLCSPKDNSLGLVMIIVIAAMCTRYFILYHPEQVVFDEVHFGKFTNWYLSGKYYFDIHPPLGKLILALGVRTFAPAYNSTFGFEKIGDKYANDPTVPYALMRSIPVTFNAMACPLVFFIARMMGCSMPPAFLAAMMITFDTATLLQSRLILIDSFLFFFAILSYFCSMGLLTYIDNSSKVFTRSYFAWLTATGLALGCTASVKWTGLSVVGGVGLQQVVSSIVRLRKKPNNESQWRSFFDLLTRGIVILIVSVATYLVFQYAHFRILTKSGPGDAFMTPKFKNTLEGSNFNGTEYPSFLEKVRELTRTMYTSNKGIKTPHHWQSMWYTWPFTKRGISYWTGVDTPNPYGGANLTSKAYLLGNPAVWWGSTGGVAIAIFVTILLMIFQVPFKPKSLSFMGHSFGLMVTWALNLLPYVMITRCTFLYHYFPALFCAVLITAVTLEQLLGGTRFNAPICGLLLIPVVVLFAYFSPMVYALPITRADLDKRVWFEGWR